MTGAGEIQPPIEEQVRAAIFAALNVAPGMGGPPEPVWETYKPEGVAIVLTNAVIDVVNPWAQRLIEVAAQTAAEAALSDRTASKSESGLSAAETAADLHLHGKSGSVS